MRRMSTAEQDQARKQLTEEMDLGLFEPSHSPWASNITWAPKPNGTLRICVDFKRINKVTIKDKYPLPRMEDIIQNISGKKFVSQ